MNFTYLSVPLKTVLYEGTDLITREVFLFKR